MKKALLNSLIILAAAGATGTAMADTGNISFQGEITESACSIGGGQQGADMIVKMGSISTNMFANGVGSTGPKTDFTIALLGCDPTIAGSANISFKPGAGSVINSRLLSLENNSGATGVALGLADENGAPIAVGGNGVTYTLQQGTNNFNFKAYYEATAATVTAGRANARAVFEVQYS